MAANLALTKEEVAENIRRLHQYSQGSEREKIFHRQTIKNGKVFVHLREANRSLFSPSKFAGYTDNNLNVSRLKERDGRDTNPHLDALIGRYLDAGADGYREIDLLFLKYCADFGIIPSAHPKARRYWSLDLSTSSTPSVETITAVPDNAWTDVELAAAVDAYFEMLDLHQAKDRYSKTAFKNALLAGPLHGRKSIDHRMQNISFLLNEMGLGWIPGFKPLPHIGGATKSRLLAMIRDRLSSRGTLLPTHPPVAREGRKLPPTGYWMFVCRRGRWDGTVWLSSDNDETLYMVSDNHRDEVQVGDLGVLRLNKLSQTRTREGQPAGVYALLEVVEAPELRVSDQEEEFSDPKDASILRWRAKVRLLANLLDKPVDVLSLPEEPEFRHLRTPLPQSTIPLTAGAYHEIVRRCGHPLSDIQQNRETSTPVGVRNLERSAANLDPKKKEKISAAIERGPLGARVKAARKHRCQICEAIGVNPVAFIKRGGAGYAEAHHVHPVSLLLAGSLADINIMVLCPNHHRQVHFGNFIVDEHREHDWLVRLDDQVLIVPRTRLAG